MSFFKNLDEVNSTTSGEPAGFALFSSSNIALNSALVAGSTLAISAA